MKVDYLLLFGTVEFDCLGEALFVIVEQFRGLFGIFCVSDKEIGKKRFGIEHDAQ